MIRAVLLGDNGPGWGRLLASSRERERVREEAGGENRRDREGERRVGGCGHVTVASCLSPGFFFICYSRSKRQ